jgi:mono/diheme cytochrome c family protein
MNRFVAATLSAMFIACFAPPTDAQVRSTAANAAAGRAMALLACTGCHVVSPDQPFAPELTGPPDFRTIANKPITTAASLRRFLSTQRPVPVPGHMADPYLTDADRENIIAFIMTLKAPR